MYAISTELELRRTACTLDANQNPIVLLGDKIERLLVDGTRFAQPPLKDAQLRQMMTCI